MNILPLFLIIALIIEPFVTLSLSTLAFTVAYPMGMSFYSLFSTYYTTEVVGEINISSLNIGSSYLPNGQYMTSGEASLQLNAMLNGTYWVQNVILFHQLTNGSFNLTLVLNLWNLTGPFTVLFPGNITTYQGFGVLIYEGPSYIVTLPMFLSLIMVVNSSGLYFGYKINNISRFYYKVPLPGVFIIGGVSLAGIPNDLEFVFGGPGDGSVVDMQIQGTMNLYYMYNGELSLVPYAYSIGFDTAESVVGIRSLANLTNLWKPNVILTYGSDDAEVLWPVKPNLTVVKSNNNLYVNLSFEGKPISGQEIYVEKLGVTGLEVLSENFTNTNGSAEFYNISSSYYVIYYPGNFTLSSDYVFLSPTLNSLISHLETAYDKLVNFLKSYNFKKAISSFFGGVRTTSTSTSTLTSTVNYTLLLYIFGLTLGMVLSALLIRFKL